MKAIKVSAFCHRQEKYRYLDAATAWASMSSHPLEAPEQTLGKAMRYAVRTCNKELMELHAQK